MDIETLDVLKGEGDTETTQANAQLIATAPELLEVCKNFFEWHANHFEDFSFQINGELLCLANECEQAINKAEGKK